MCEDIVYLLVLVILAVSVCRNIFIMLSILKERWYLHLTPSAYISNAQQRWKWEKIKHKWHHRLTHGGIIDPCATIINVQERWGDIKMHHSTSPSAYSMRESLKWQNKSDDRYKVKTLWKTVKIKKKKKRADPAIKQTNASLKLERLDNL